MQELNSSLQQNIKEVSGTKEWATANVNIYHGCPNDCLYCYAKSIAIHYKRKTSENWKDGELNKKNYYRSVRKRNGRLMFPSSHDITIENVHFIKIKLLNLISARNSVLVVSKPVFACIKSICDTFTNFRDQILFRFTITSTNNDVLKFWEPNAPSFDERLRALKYAFEKDFQTSISCEPYLDNSIVELIDEVRPYVTDSIWIGKANRLKSILGINKHNDEVTLRKANQLLELYSSGYSQFLYDKYKNDPMIKWKESLKKEFGIPLATESGLDQ